MITLDQFSTIILPHTLRHEGGYVNKKNDKGGETYRGISRINNPLWEGWKILEKYKLHQGDIINDAALKEAVRSLYFNNYFKPNSFEQFNSSMVVITCFDFEVNGGYSGKVIQSVLNNHFDARLLVDGQVGAKTLAAINTANEADLSNTILDYRLERFHRIVENDPSQEEFLEGWENRIAYFRKLIKTNTVQR